MECHTPNTAYRSQPGKTKSNNRRNNDNDFLGGKQSNFQHFRSFDHYNISGLNLRNQTKSLNPAYNNARQAQKLEDSTDSPLGTGKLYINSHLH